MSMTAELKLKAEMDGAMKTFTVGAMLTSVEMIRKAAKTVLDATSNDEDPLYLVMTYAGNVLDGRIREEDRLNAMIDGAINALERCDESDEAAIQAALDILWERQ